MKKSHILILVVIAAAVGLLISTAGDASSYVTFSEAYQLASTGSEKNIHVVGELKKDGNGQVIGIENPALDKVSFSFIMVDDNGKEQKVIYGNRCRRILLKSEKVVVIGSYDGDVF